MLLEYVCLMSHELGPGKAFEIITRDFRKAWDAMAMADFDMNVGGNFMFAMQAMILLELTCRVAAADTTGDALHDFSSELERLNPLYFTPLPGGPGKDPRGWRLPWAAPVSPARPRRWQLVSVLYDLIRNGHAHRYEQQSVRMSDKRWFSIALSGVDREHPLGRDWAPGSGNADHLTFQQTDDDDIWLWVLPDYLFLDFECAARRARVFDRGLMAEPLHREGGSYGFSSDRLARAIEDSQHLFIRSARPRRRP